MPEILPPPPRAGAVCDIGNFRPRLLKGSPGHEGLSFRHRRVRSDPCIAADAGGCPHRLLLPSSCRIDRPGPVRFQHPGAMYAHSIGVERDLQPSFQIVSSQPITDTRGRLELVLRCHREAGREFTMRRTTLILLGVVSLTSFGVPPAEAARRQYPYCMQGATSPGLSNCTFTSRAQCQATASGRRLSCIRNPFYGQPTRRSRS